MSANVRRGALGPGGPASGAPSPGALPAGSSLSLFELPVSRGARIARVALILVLDAILIGAGVAMIISYLHARDRARGQPPSVEAQETEAEVEVLPPEPIMPEPSAAAAAAARRPPAPASRETAAVRRRSSERRDRTAGSAGEAPTPAVSAPASADASVQTEPTSGAPTPATPAAVADAGSPAADGPVQPGSATPERVGARDAGAAGGDGGLASAGAEIEALGRKIGLVVEAHKAQLERCYRQAAKGSTPSEPLQGRVVVRFGIMPDGQAQDARAEENTSGSDRLATCVAAEIETWKFPGHGAARALEFRWPFVFKAPR